MKISLAIFIFVFALVAGFQKEERFIGRPLPGLRDFVEEFENQLSKQLDGVSGLTDDQREVLRLKLSAKIIDYPNSQNVETIKPSQLAKYLEGARKYVAGVIDELVQEAHQLVKDSTKARRQLPGLTDLIEEQLAKLNRGLDDVEDLNGSQRNALVQELKKALIDFPNSRHIETVKPSEFKAFQQKIRDFADRKIERLLIRAKDIAEAGKPGKLPKAKRQLPGLANLVEEILGKLNKALDDVRHLNGRDRNNLVQELRKAIIDYPNNNNIHTVKPSEFKEYQQKIRDFADTVIEKLVAEAKTLAEGGKLAKRFIPVIGKLIDRFVQTFQNIVHRVTGLSAEQQEAFIDEFKQKLSKVPKPSFDIWDLTNPRKVVGYIKELTAFNIKLTREIFAKIRNIVTGNLPEELEIPAEETPEETPVEKRADDDGLIEGGIKKAFAYAINLIPNISDAIKAAIILEFNAEMDRMPPPPSKWKVSAWVKYYADLNIYASQLTTRLLGKATDLVLQELKKLSPGLGNLLSKREIEERDISSFFKNLVKQAEQNLKESLRKIAGITKQELDNMVTEFDEIAKTFPYPKLSDFMGVAAIKNYVKKFQTFSLNLASALLEKAKAIVDRHLNGGNKRAVDFNGIIQSVKDKFMSALKTGLDAIGLSAENRQKIADRFRAFIDSFPSLREKYLGDDSKVMEYARKLSDFAQKAVTSFLNMAKAFFGRE